jgi:hypothetical protein
MNTIVREMNPAGEIELTDAQLAAVYGACDNDVQPVCEEKPICHEHKKHSTTIIHKKVVFFFEEDFFVKKDDDESSFSNSW